MRILRYISLNDFLNNCGDYSEKQKEINIKQIEVDQIFKGQDILLGLVRSVHFIIL